MRKIENKIMLITYADSLGGNLRQLDRMLDTGIGVAIALLVNWLLPREKVVHWLDKLHKKTGRR